MKENVNNIDNRIRFVARHYKKDVFNAEKAWPQLAKRIGFPPKKRRLTPFYWAAAAFVGIVFSGILLFTSNKTEKLVATADETVFTLPDNSVVNMKKGAYLGYDKHFGKTERKVEMRGEIDFDVAHDTQKPFIVSTPTASVKVLGTVFNINENEQGTQLRVTSGKVLFMPSDFSVSFVCEANSSAIYNANEKEITHRSSEARISVNAALNSLFFENASLKEVSEVLSQYFYTAITVPVEEQTLAFSSTFTNQSIQDIVRIINLTLDSHIDISK